MEFPGTQSVRLAEGNGTLRELMADVLVAAGADVRRETGDELADLLVADVDSSFNGIDDLMATYRRENRPVLVCGLGESRERYASSADEWLNRPFDSTELLVRCRRALGLEVDEAAEEAADEHSSQGSFSGEEEVLEIDGASSMVLDVQDLEESFGSGGRLASRPVTELLDVDRLVERAETLSPLSEASDPKTNPTLPEVPAEREDSASEAERTDSSETEVSRPTSVGSEPTRRSGPHEAPEAPDPPGGDVRDSGPHGDPTEAAPLRPETPGADRGSRPSGSQPVRKPDGMAGELEQQLSELAELLANSWDRVGLAARWEDRAERLARTFDALVGRGLQAAEEELERIPPSNGFSGDLEIFPVFDILTSLRDQGLRGRLEISSKSGGYVVYVDGPTVVGIDDLEGRSEAMLLDCLQEAGMLGERTYDRLQATLEDSMAAPLQMRLRTEEIVTDDELMEGRRIRAKWVLKEVLSAVAGTFAFVAGGDDAGQPWPVDELGLSLDNLLLDLMRERAFEWPAVSLESQTIVATVAADSSFGDEELTDLERSILGEAAGSIRVGDLEAELDVPPEAVRSAVERLVGVGVLEKVARRRSGEHRRSTGEFESKTAGREASEPTAERPSPSIPDEARPGESEAEITENQPIEGNPMSRTDETSEGE